jgi:hypothetical protein
MLLANEVATAGQGYCLALARFGGVEDTEVLAEYLSRYLPGYGGEQDWALGALLFLDARLGTVRAAPFLVSGGPWEQSWLGRGHPSYADPDQNHDKIARLCAFVTAYELPQPA